MEYRPKKRAGIVNATLLLGVITCMIFTLASHTKASSLKEPQADIRAVESAPAANISEPKTPTANFALPTRNLEALDYPIDCNVDILREPVEPVKVEEEAAPVYLGEFTLVAYCNCEKCCGKWSGGQTKTGTTPKAGRTVAVDPSVIPLSSTILIDGKPYVAEDTGSGIKGKKIDIFFSSHTEALKFGRRTGEVSLEPSSVNG